MNASKGSVEKIAKESVVTTTGVGAIKRPKFTVISCKCIKCALPFKIYTEHPEKWRRRLNGIILGTNCPECTSKAVYTISWITKEGWIFQECPEQLVSDRDYMKFAKEMSKRGESK